MFDFPIVAPKEQSVYESNDKKEGSVRGRKGAFKANIYEKEVTLERLRRKRQERMEEEAKQEAEARFEEAKREKARHEQVSLEEARIEEDKLQEARLDEPVGQAVELEEPSQTIEVESRKSSLPTAASVNGSITVSDGDLEKRPSSSLKNRAPCPTCQVCSVKPFQVLKYRKMNDVLRMSQDSGYNYLCLSGIMQDACLRMLSTSITVFTTRAAMLLIYYVCLPCMLLCLLHTLLRLPQHCCVYHNITVFTTRAAMLLIYYACLPCMLLCLLHTLLRLPQHCCVYHNITVFTTRAAMLLIYYACLPCILLCLSYTLLRLPQHCCVYHNIAAFTTTLLCVHNIALYKIYCVACCILLLYVLVVPHTVLSEASPAIADHALK